jgi:hypothetical protein
MKKSQNLFFFDTVFGRRNLRITSNVDFTQLTYAKHRPSVWNGLYTAKVTHSDVKRLKDAGFTQVFNFNDLLINK